LVSFYRHGAHPNLPSFPTRRSSDLAIRAMPVGAADGGIDDGTITINEKLTYGARELGDGDHLGALRIDDAERAICREVDVVIVRSEEHTSELQSLTNLVCRLLLEKK